jgi:hypothetical protein
VTRIRVTAALTRKPKKAGGGGEHEDRNEHRQKRALARAKHWLLLPHAHSVTTRLCRRPLLLLLVGLHDRRLDTLYVRRRDPFDLTVK